MQEFGIYILAMTGLVAAVSIFVCTAARAVSWARKGSPVAMFIGWALLLLGAGMNPQSPPQEQVEDANRQKKIKKDTESGDPNG